MLVLRVKRYRNLKRNYVFVICGFYLKVCTSLISNFSSNLGENICFKHRTAYSTLRSYEMPSRDNYLGDGCDWSQLRKYSHYLALEKRVIKVIFRTRGKLPISFQVLGYILIIVVVACLYRYTGNDLSWCHIHFIIKRFFKMGYLQIYNGSPFVDLIIGWFLLTFCLYQLV
jgi:hypothetical protein